ncbi:response regulator [Propionivibrio sp.]|uniref:response regulator n=1 Tax=Propionivibrio sp. TaxID=2212460 RepID=UPI003BF390C9
MKKILIVDDQPSIRTIVRLALRGRFAIEEAGEADTAYEYILANHPDAVVLDVMMPGSMNGYQLCELIKRDAGLADIHVVMMTARGQVKDQEFGHALGADAYFVKPFSPLAMARHLSAALLPDSGTLVDHAPVEKKKIIAPTLPALTDFEAAWTHSPWAMVAVGGDGNVCVVNPAFERCTGMPGPAVIGMGEAGLKALLDSLSLEHHRVEMPATRFRVIHYLHQAPAPIKGAQQLSHVAELLREPLASVFGFAELLLTQNYEEDIRLDLTATLLEQVEAMSNILNEHLNVASNQPGDSQR